MTLIDKLNMLDFTEEEKEKAKNKFLSILALVTDDELKERLEYLKSQGVSITKAREIKVLTISKEDLMKNFSVLDEIHETDLYRAEPIALTLNVIDVYKRIKYCIQNGIEYKWEEGEQNG